MGKTYNDVREEMKRRLIYEDNVAFISKHNLEAQRGKYSYILGEGPFTDMTNEEYRKATACTRPSNLPKVTRQPSKSSVMDAPDSIDWRTHGVVNPPQTQMCNDCWSFSSVSVTESRYAIKNSKLYKLSEQQLVDCDADNNGCDPSYVGRAYNYIVKNGLETESAYPYGQGVQNKCTFDKAQVVVNVKVYDGLAPNAEKFRQEVGTNGPITLGIASASPAFQHYAGGILDETCSTVTDHAITAIGYGNGNGTDFWILKNSWGTKWGEGGYMRIARGKNMCGIERDPAFFCIP